MVAVKSAVAFLPWLAGASGLSATGPHAALPTPQCRPISMSSSYYQSSRTATATALRLSVNDDVSGFHYDQEPRGQSFLSQVSREDLLKRRQTRQRLRRSSRGRTPNSRGAFHAQQQQQGPPPVVPPPQYQDLRNGNNMPPPSPQYQNLRNDNVNVAPPQQQQQQQRPIVPGDEFDSFKSVVSESLAAMTGVLREMQRSQAVQSSDVYALSQKVSNISERLDVADMKNRIINDASPPPTASSGVNAKSFGTSLDGQFHRKIKDVIDEFEMVDRNGDDDDAVPGGMSWDVGQRRQQQQQQPQVGEGEYYRGKINQLESKINKIDAALGAMEDNFSDQMEYVDVLINDRLDVDAGIDAGMGRQMEFRRPMPPPPPRMEEVEAEVVMPPPQMEEIPPPLPPPPVQESLGEGNPYYVDDGTRYFQERNFNAGTFSGGIPSMQNPNNSMQDFRQGGNSMQSGNAYAGGANNQQMYGRSVNDSSGGYHYKEKNSSFMSSFSKADNEARRWYNPAQDGGRRNRISSAEQLSRGEPLSRGSSSGRYPMGYMRPNVGGYYDGSYPMMDGGMMMEGDMMMNDGPMVGGDYMMDEGPMIEGNYFFDEIY